MADPQQCGRFHEEPGIWVRLQPQRDTAERPALFLDRDGVIVEDPGYLSRAADMTMIPGAAEVIASANRQGIPVVAVTNQAGIGRGYYGWKEFLDVEEAIARELNRYGACLDAVIACPFHRAGIEPWRHPAHPARKPNPGMLLAARQFLNIDLQRSWIIGDKICDLQAGRNAGLRGGMHVLTGHGREHRNDVSTVAGDGFELRCGDSIRDAASLLELLVRG